MDKLNEDKTLTSATIKALQVIAKLVGGLVDSPAEEHKYLLVLRDAGKMYAGISNRWKRHMDQLFMEMTDRVLRGSDAVPDPKRLAKEFGGLAESVGAILNQANDSGHRIVGLHGKRKVGFDRENLLFAYYVRGHTQQWLAEAIGVTQTSVSRAILRETEPLKKLAERTKKKGG